MAHLSVNPKILIDSLEGLYDRVPDQAPAILLQFWDPFCGLRNTWVVCTETPTCGVVVGIHQM